MMPEIALQCLRITNTGGAIRMTPGCRSKPGSISRPTDFLSEMNPRACRMRELAHVPERDDFYEAFLAPMESRMLRAVWRIVRNPDMVQDTVQDALTAIWRCREKIRLHPNPQALMLKIATDVSYDAMRRSLRRQRLEQPEEEGKEAMILHAPPATEVEQDQFEKGIRAAIARLPRQQAIAVLMRLVHEQPYPSVARALGCSEPTARIHVMRGRARLRRLLSRLGMVIYGRERDRQ